MRYGVSFIPTCVAIVHLVGTTLPVPITDGCPVDSPTLAKRDADAHISIPHVVASFDPQPLAHPAAEPSNEKTHSLQKRSEPGRGKKEPWYMRTFSGLNRLCGTSSIKQEAAQNALPRQSNAGTSQQNVIAPEDGDEQIIDQPVIDLGNNNNNNQQQQQQGDQPQFQIDLGDNQEAENQRFVSPVTRNRGVSTVPGGVRSTRNFGTNNQGMNYVPEELNEDGGIPGTRGGNLPANPSPMRIQDTGGFHGLTKNVEPIPEQRGREASGDYAGMMDEDLRQSLSESQQNPFIPSPKSRTRFYDSPSWFRDDILFSDEEAEADVEGTGRTVVNNQPTTATDQDPMRAGRWKKMFMSYAVPYAVEKTFGVDITPYMEHEGVQAYLAGRTNEKPKPKPKLGFFRRLLKGREGMDKAPEWNPPNPYLGKIDMKPGYVVNPSEAMARLTAEMNEEADRQANMGLSASTVKKQTAQREKMEKEYIDGQEAKRRQKLWDELYDDNEPIYQQNEEKFTMVEESGGSNLAQSTDQLEKAQIFSGSLLRNPQLESEVSNQPQVVNNPLEQSQVLQKQNVVPNTMNQAQKLQRGQMDMSQAQDSQTGVQPKTENESPESNLEDQGNDDYLSFGENYEYLIGDEDTANFEGNLLQSTQSQGNLGGSTRSQGWNLGISQIPQRVRPQDVEEIAETIPATTGDTEILETEETNVLTDPQTIENALKFSFANPTARDQAQGQ